jgi:hypothetical protein
MPIHRHHSLTLDFSSLRRPTTAYTALHVATAVIKEARALQKVDLKYIIVI